MADIAPTRSAALELAAEKQLMKQGFGFLDEKRMLLAAEILRTLRRYEAAELEMAQCEDAARKTLAAASERHGFDALQVYPAPAEAPRPTAPKRVRYVGVPLREAEAWRIEGDPVAPPLDPSPEAERCRDAFRRWLELALEIGVLASNLERLGREYRRVERRAKALENVLIPEVDSSLKRVQEQLEVLDQEEAVRVRIAGRHV